MMNFACWRLQVNKFVIMEGGALPVPSIFTKIEKVASVDPSLAQRHLGKSQKSACCGAGGG